MTTGLFCTTGLFSYHKQPHVSLMPCPAPQRLWTIQREAFFDQVARDGVSQVDWSLVLTSYLPAYHYLQREAAARLNRPIPPFAPVWAFHSCGQWQRGPTYGDIDMLCSLDHPRSSPLMIAALNVAPAEFVLTVYGPWCDLLLEHEFPPEDERVKALWDVAPPPRKGGNGADLQAVLLELRRDQIVATAPLKEAFRKDGTLRARLR